MKNDSSPPPEFARKIIEKYVSSQSNTFLIFGNTGDIYPVTPSQYVTLTDFLVKALIKPDSPPRARIVMSYDPASGISFLNPADRQLVAREIGGERLDRILSASRRDIVAACASLREFTRLDIMVEAPGEPNRKIRKDFAIIIQHGEAVAPPSRGDMMLDEDRLKALTLENWFSDRAFVASSNIVFLIGETLNGINERIVDLPYVSAIRVDRPDKDDRKRFVEHLMQEEEIGSSVTSDQLAFSSAGLPLLSIRQIFRQAAYKGEMITPSLLFDKTKEIIEKELEGHIEFPVLEYGFEKVIGASRLLKKLRELVVYLDGDDKELMPIGILVPGANGVGKTFIYKAFARECGWVAVALKNIRGPYVGQTEKNWERIRSVLEAMSNVMVLYDEADTEIGGRSAQTHDVDRRLFGNILKMMSDSGNRGKIVWIIITARPDRLEPDIKRSGRAGEHLPVFDNEGEEKEEFLRHVLGQAGIDMETFLPDEIADFRELTETYYPADFDQLLTELRRRRHLDGDLTPQTMLEELRDFMPSDTARQREYQELLAVLECTSREILPRRYALLSREEVRRRVREIRSNMARL